MEEPWAVPALCIPHARSTSFPIQSSDHQAAALGTQLQLGLGKARYSSWLKCSQMTTKSSIPHQVRHDNGQLLLQPSQWSCPPVLSLPPHQYTALCHWLQKHRPGSLIQLHYTINKTKHKQAKLSLTPRLSLSSRTGDTSKSPFPRHNEGQPETKAEQLPSQVYYTCLLPAGSNVLLHSASSHNFGEGKEKPPIETRSI